jgi:hypothetical protein
MYAFRKNLNLLLHQKIIQITPQPITLAALVDKAQDLNRNWCLYRGPHNSSRGPQGPRHNPNTRIQEMAAAEPPNVEINVIQSKGKFLK